jgi:hypothetical protein
MVFARLSIGARFLMPRLAAPGSGKARGLDGTRVAPFSRFAFTPAGRADMKPGGHGLAKFGAGVER